MLNRLSIPVGWQTRVLAILALIGVVFAFGYIKGKQSGAADMEKFKGSVMVVGVKQQTKIDIAAQNADKISSDRGDKYEKSRSHLAAIYGPGRVRQPSGSGSNKAEAVPEATGQFNGGSADNGLGSGIRAPEAVESRECKALKADAAQTTLQLLNLRAWVEEQTLNWDSTVVE